MFNLHLLILSCLLFSRAIAEDATTATANSETDDTLTTTAAHEEGVAPALAGLRSNVLLGSTKRTADTAENVEVTCSRDSSYDHIKVTVQCGPYPHGCGSYPHGHHNHGCKEHNHGCRDHNHGCRDHNHGCRDHNHGCKDHNGDKDGNKDGSKDDKDPPPPPPPPQCKTGYVLLGRNCYYFNSGTTTWGDAFYRCRNLGGTLAFPLDATEDNLIREYAKTFNPNQGGWWLGGTDSAQEGVWKWIHSQEKIIYTNWLPYQPDNKDNEDCLGYSGTGRNPNWNDYTCNSKLSYICQNEPITPI